MFREHEIPTFVSTSWNRKARDGVSTIFKKAIMNFAAIICTTATLLGPALGNVLMCYFGSWATYCPGNGNFEVSNIEPNLCTHYIYSFIGITGTGEVDILDEWNDIADGGGKNNFGKLTALKNTKTAPKILVGVGGWNAGSTNFTIVVNNATLRATFVTNVIVFLKKYNFDGLDLDWEYPNQRGGQASDKEGFVAFAKELKEAFVKEGLLLTAGVGATKDLATLSYDIPALAEYLDYINVMTYDFTIASFSDVVGHHAPLLPASYQANNAALLQNNLLTSINFWLDSGAPASKLVLGLALYGRTFKLADTSKTTPGSPSAGPGNAGPYTDGAGSLGYNELCEQQLSGNWTTVWYDEQQVPYTYSGDQWVGFDNERSLTIKINYAKQLGLAGIMFWSIETDDFRGICGDTTYPLLKAAKAALSDPSKTTSHPDPMNEDDENHDDSEHNNDYDDENVPSEDHIISNTVCTGNSYHRHKTDCTKFWQCVGLTTGGYKEYLLECPAPLVFDTTLNVCNWARTVDC